MNASRLSPGVPLASLGLPPVLHADLHAHGVATHAQVHELLALESFPRPRHHPAPSAQAGHVVAAPLASELRAALASPPPTGPMATGIAGPLSASPRARERRGVRRRAKEQLLRVVRGLERDVRLPTSKLLTEYMTPVRNQGLLGACTGFGSTGSREFLAPVDEVLAPLYAYAGAKALDGAPGVEGSWQTFCFQWMAQVGHVPERLFPYTDKPASLAIRHLDEDARALRIDAFLDLLLDEDDPEAFASMPFLLKCALTGDLTPDLGPQTVSISIAVHESMRSASTRLFGLVTLPFPGERLVSGHALTLVGFLDADDPSGLYDQDYFICKNSWSENWAAQNPLGLPGYALIPAPYFASPRRLWEALMVVAEPSPAREPSWRRAIAALWRT